MDRSSAKAGGARFVHAKATESTPYRNPYFAQQYQGSRRAHHLALPDRSSGRARAARLVRHGGDRTADDRTLPPALDIEYNPYDRKRERHGPGKARVTGRIRSFSGEVRRLTGRRPVICPTAHRWNTRTGNSRAFTADHALWIARYDASDPGAPPAGRWSWTFRQHDNGGGTLPGDRNLFDGSPDRMKRSSGAPGGPHRGAARTARRRSRHPAERPPPLTVTTMPIPVHLPFTLVTYVRPANDLERLPG